MSSINLVVYKDGDYLQSQPTSNKTTLIAQKNDDNTIDVLSTLKLGTSGMLDLTPAIPTVNPFVTTSLPGGAGYKGSAGFEGSSGFQGSVGFRDPLLLVALLVLRVVLDIKDLLVLLVQDIKGARVSRVLHRLVVMLVH